MRIVHLAAASLTLILAACAGYESAEPSVRAEAPPAATDAKFQQDRDAILDMVGTYDVTFHFEETVGLQPGYELKPVKTVGGQELVFLVEDQGDVIRLQHLLVVGDPADPIVVKHWRQDWVYEPERVTDYAGHETWRVREVPADERRGAWAQNVYQVDDSPRYAAVARWTHDNGVSTWESPVTWRPLPRRDATTRDDYHVIAAVNRHTITPWGWSHEQDNEKLVLGAGTPEALVREIGVNTYRRVENFPHAATDAYWQATADYWAAIRERWDQMEAQAARLAVDGKEPEDPLYIPLLTLADKIADGDLTVTAALDEADAVLDKRVSAAAQ